SCRRTSFRQPNGPMPRIRWCSSPDASSSIGTPAAWRGAHRCSMRWSLNPLHRSIPPIWRRLARSRVMWSPSNRAAAMLRCKLVMHDGSEHVAREVRATDNYANAGPHDIVILAMKAHQVEAVANNVPMLFGPQTVVVTMQNGIPYWYFHKHGGELAGSVVKNVDPSGLISAKIPAERVIGCVVYPA